VVFIARLARATVLCVLGIGVCTQKLHGYRELGVERVVLGVGLTDVDLKEKVPPFLDRYARLISKLA
jgi:hypothetical protein